MNGTRSHGKATCKCCHRYAGSWAATTFACPRGGSFNKVWETIRENIKISVKESLGYYELKENKAWFDEGCSELFDQRKLAKLQWLQDPSKINGGNLNNIP
jgi:hypothetical protein